MANEKIPFTGTAEDFPQLIQYLCNATGEIIKESTLSDMVILQRYGAWATDSFTNLMGYTATKVRSQFARLATVENLDTEKRENHPGMLSDFLYQVDAAPTSEAYAHMYPFVERIRDGQRDPRAVALFGLMFFAAVENTSLIFVPDVGKRAERLGAANLLYVTIHGDADVAHAKAFIDASMAEAAEGVYDYSATAERAAQLMLDIHRAVYQ